MFLRHFAVMQYLSYFRRFAGLLIQLTIFCSEHQIDQIDEVLYIIKKYLFCSAVLIHILL